MDLQSSCKRKRPSPAVLIFIFFGAPMKTTNYKFRTRQSVAYAEILRKRREKSPRTAGNESRVVALIRLADLPLMRAGGSSSGIFARIRRDLPNQNRWLALPSRSCPPSRQNFSCSYFSPDDIALMNNILSWRLNTKKDLVFMVLAPILKCIPR